MTTSAPEPAPAPRASYGRRALRLLAYAAVWALVAVPVTVWLFVHTSQDTVLASHDATLRPTYDGRATLHLGPFLPDVRRDVGGRIGVDLVLGRTEASSSSELVQRYAFIASNPRPQVRKAEAVVRDIALRSALRGGLVGLLPIGVWLLLGRDRRRDLGRRLRRPVVPATAGVVVVVLVAGVWQPWQSAPPSVTARQRWVPLAEAVPDVPLPAEARALQVRADLTTSTTRRLVTSAVDTYDRSKTFYRAAAKAAGDLDLHRPERGQTVALLLSDRHDNIGMDAVARAVADRGGATAVIDAGDDTSTGSEWEAFSLDSLDDAFGDLDRWAIAGNHDNGTFVARYLAGLGWTHLTGEVVDGPGGSRIMGVDDPRSSGLGTWRDQKGLSFGEQREKIADAACAAEKDGDRIGTLVVHDANSGREALSRGCVDLVLSGHLHVQVGPEREVGTDGRAGYRYTNGTTGGAAYAIAVGSKLRREAEVTLVTYADGRPAGLQPVRLRTDGRFVVDDYVPLDLG